MNDLPIHVQVLQTLLGQWTSSAVCALAKLGIPDHVQAGPKSAAELASEIGAQPELLYRLMRATANVGFLTEGPDGKFSQTPLSDLLRSDSKPSFRQVAMFNLDDWHIHGWSKLAETVRTGERAVDKAYGPIFEYFGTHAEEAARFNGAMTDLSSLDAPAVAEAYDFSGIKSLTDVAGGHGLLLATILQKNAGMKGTLYDLP